MVLGKRAIVKLPWSFHIRAPMLRGKKFNMRALGLRGKRTMGSRMRRLAGWQTAADNTALLNLKIATAYMQQQEQQKEQEEQEELEAMVVPWRMYLQSPRLRG